MRRYTLAALLPALMATLVALPVRAADPAPAPQAIQHTYWDVAQVVDAARPSVVGIVVTLPPKKPGSKPRHASGTGVAYGRGDWIVTCAHVVYGATSVAVLLPSGKVAPAQLADVYADHVSDIAVIHLSGQNLPPLPFAAPGDIRVGQMAIAVGNPLGFRLGDTVSVGVISGSGRALGTGYPFLQTDAAINPGNSGGPLLNADGKLVGITSAKIVARGVEGLGFAIPSGVVQQIADALIRDGKITRAWIGVTISQSESADFGLPTDDGLSVDAVIAGSPADGVLQEGDQLNAVDGHAVHTLDDLAALLAQDKPGQSTMLSIQRDGVAYDRQLTLGTMPNEPPDTSGKKPASQGIWRNLDTDQVATAVEYARTHLNESFSQFTKGYVQKGNNGVTAFLQTEFMYIADKVWEAARQGQTSEGLLLESIGHSHGYIEVQVLVPGKKPDGSYQPSWSGTLVQGDKTISGQQGFLNPSGVGLHPDAPPPDGLVVYQFSFRFPSADLDPAQPLTFQIQGNDGSQTSFPFDLKSLR